MLGGCSLVPSYNQPDVPLASAWTGAQGAAEAPASGGPWWKEFHSQELDGLIAKGLSENYTLKAAMSRIDEARGLAQIGRAHV